MLKVRDFLATAEAALIAGTRITDNQCGAFGGYSEEEAKAIAVRLCEEVLGVKSYQWVLDPSMEVPSSAEARLSSSLDRLCGGEPLQYVLGYAYFCGFQFRVSPAVLIPRPETEELCRLVVSGVEDDFGDYALSRGSGVPGRERDFTGLRILDLCTGSGCIAWSLAMLLPRAEVFGVDVSEDALAVARTQPLADEAARHGAKVPQFVQADILSDTFFGLASEKSVHINGVSSHSAGSSSSVDSSLSTDAGCPDYFDIIVSNPPYIRLSERDALPENVKDHEPDLALFVPDDDPLIFYRAIANFSVKRLRTGGFGFVEINEALGEPTRAIFSSAGFSSVKILRDFRAKFRFIFFKK